MLGSLPQRPFLLYNKIQHYAWGASNESAYIPKLINQEVERDRPYAELWMGAHPSASSEIIVHNNKESLYQLLKAYPNDILGEYAKKFNQEMPFLLKVLSAAHPLSIQVHPNLKQAALLHQKDPEHYPDSNHKPEIAIALDHLKALIGFRPLPKILSQLQSYSEICNFLGSEHINTFSKQMNTQPKEALRNIYKLLMSKALNEKDRLMETLNQLENKIQLKEDLSEHELLFLQLKKQYQNTDAGLLSIFFLNLVHLKKGQAVFLKAGIPHAYLNGNIIECMANSDNVVRAGLTNKYQDINTLVELLTYETETIQILESSDDSLSSFNLPIEDFKINIWNLKEGKKIEHHSNKSPSIYLITEGSITIASPNHSDTFTKGNSLLIPACLSNYKIISEQDTVLYQALPA